MIGIIMVANECTHCARHTVLPRFGTVVNDLQRPTESFSQDPNLLLEAKTLLMEPSVMFLLKPEPLPSLTSTVGSHFVRFSVQLRAHRM